MIYQFNFGHTSVLKQNRDKKGKGCKTGLHVFTVQRIYGLSFAVDLSLSVTPACGALIIRQKTLADGATED